MAEYEGVEALALGPYKARAHFRRGRWWQCIAEDPQKHLQLWLAMLGRIRAEKQDTTNEDGTIRADANPWAHQLQEDISLLSSLEGMPEEQCCSNPPVAKLAYEADLADVFCRVDLAALRAQFWSNYFAPPISHRLGGLHSLSSRSLVLT